ncbi:unnamed protein product [Sphenostylis stenocarpa]|uniref:Uncharacterized protein n=1 Tax=Sphenostylis stenocarpa TaxID=92480 RepID=A0AA86SFJ2_9FABA|nr:unnamed protein product [Sphenostylis stenocarpa]
MSSATISSKVSFGSRSHFPSCHCGELVGSQGRPKGVLTRLCSDSSKVVHHLSPLPTGEASARQHRLRTRGKSPPLELRRGFATTPRGSAGLQIW